MFLTSIYVRIVTCRWFPSHLALWAVCQSLLAYWRCIYIYLSLSQVQPVHIGPAFLLAMQSTLHSDPAKWMTGSLTISSPSAPGVTLREVKVWGLNVSACCWEVRPLSPVSPEQFRPSCACDTVCLLVLVCLQRIPRLPGAGHGPGLGEHALLHERFPVHGHVQRHDPEGMLGTVQPFEGRAPTFQVWMLSSEAILSSPALSPKRHSLPWVLVRC